MNKKNQDMMHVILGAGGATANALLGELEQNKQTVRLVSRRPIPTNGSNISWKKADLLVYSEVIEATKGAGVIYICNGVGYKTSDWTAQWPVIMQNAIDAAKQTGARLIFFDNTYMYGRVIGPMTEQTPYNPHSVKGEVRAKIATKFMEEITAGNITGSIARAPAFYGTDSLQSVVDKVVINRIANGKRARWFGDAKYLHNFAYMPDMGKALFLLGQSTIGDSKVWHLPTAPPITGLEFIQLTSDIYGTEPQYSGINKPLLFLLSLFDKSAASQLEMFYNWEQDYNFVSSKFEEIFSMQPTSFADGLKNYKVPDLV